MSLIIESLDDVRNLVKRLGIKVNTIDELKDLLNAIKSQNDPEAAPIGSSRTSPAWVLAYRPFSPPSSRVA